MAFANSARVRVTSQHSEHRGLYGTVTKRAADTSHGYNEVRIDGGQAVGDVRLLSDAELGPTNFPSPITY